ncbi:MAG TPA: OmpH family outer membrane protein [Tepidisphaeraceae bacterium]|jgi:hypothetical protein|nr:OmpH family outer membrane protein [Tepidisphaeraceae bacterium]
MKRAFLSAVVLASLFGVVSCNNDRSSGTGPKSDGSSGTTAVVDLDKVARDLGWMTKLQSNLENYQGQLRQDLGKYAQIYDEQIKEQIHGMLPPGTKPEDKVQLSLVQSQQLTNLVGAGRQQINGLAQKGDQLFGNYRGSWIRQYREALAPIIRQVAEEKKMNIVLVQSDTVLFADRGVDMTDAVVDAARAKPPALTEVPMTHLEGPPTIQTSAQPQIGGSTTQPTQPTTQPKAD